MERTLQHIYTSGVGAIVAILFVVIITVWAELSPALKTGLAGVTGHHWVTKSVLSVVVYVLIMGVLETMVRQPGINRVRRVIVWVVVAALGGTIALTSFFIWHSM